jgi:hypothetical protein
MINYSDLTHNNITVGTVYIYKIGKFFHSRLGRFEAWNVLGLGCFRVRTFWGFGRFEAWDVLKLGMFWDVFGLRTFCGL